jgi:hypothetical protein
LRLTTKDFRTFFTQEIERLTLLKTRLNQSLAQLDRKAANQEKEIKQALEQVAQLKKKVDAQLVETGKNDKNVSQEIVQRETATLTRLSVQLEVIAQRLSVQQRSLSQRDGQIEKIKAVATQQRERIDQQVTQLYTAMEEVEMTEQNKALASMMQSVGLGNVGDNAGLDGVIEAIRRMYVHSDVKLDMAAQSFDEGQSAALEEARYRELLNDVAAQTADDGEGQKAAQSQARKS